MARKKAKKGTPNLPVPNPERAAPKVKLPEGFTDDDVVKILWSYYHEGYFNRLGGPSPREIMWRDLIDLYWNRWDFSKKAEWQAHEVMPEVPMFVDRFAAAMREALTAGNQLFVIDAPNDTENDLANVIRKVMDWLLERCGRDALGHEIPFDAVFEELMKLGALAIVCGVVTWKGGDEAGSGYPAIEPLDPRTVWVDASMRNLYRVRRYEIDKTQLMALARLEDGSGTPIYDLEQLESLTASILLKMEWDRANLTGTSQWTQSNRQPITIDEYLCTLVAPDGTLVAENVLCVVANERYLIRGPEENPFWHGGDWVVMAPLVTAPLSPYGKAYIENLATLARTFNDLTNLILDGTYTTSLKAFAMDPNALDDPTQVDEGIWPNKIFKLADGQSAKDFIQEVNLGQLPEQAIQVWQALKSEMMEGAAFSELSLGQFAPKGRTSASEVQSVQNNSSALMRSVAKNVEQRVVEPLLRLLWQTWLQHMPARDKAMEDVIGEQWYRTIYKARKELATKKITFRVRGISALVARMQKLQQLLNMLQVIAQNQQLTAAFLQKCPPDKLLDLLFKLYDIDPSEMELTPREQLIRQITAAQQPPQPGAAPGGPPGATPTLPAPNPVMAAPRATPQANVAAALPRAA